MRPPSFPTSKTSRRRLLSSVAKSIAIATVPRSVYSASDKPLHLFAAERARSLAGAGPKSLRLLIPAGSGDNLVPVINAFLQLTGVEISIAQAPVDDINTVLTLDTLSGVSEYDLALPATFGIPDLAAAKAILPLTDFAAKYEPPGFRDEALYQIGDRFDGQIYGFQTDGDAYLMFYRRELLESPDEKARYADRFDTALDVPTTWQELDRQMAFFHRPEKGMFGGLLFRTPAYLAWEWWVRFHAKGLWPLDTQLNPQINTPEGVEALEEMITATRSLAPEVGQLGLFENWKRYSQNDVYCNIGWGGSQKYFNRPNSKLRGKLAFGATPGGYVDGELLPTPYFNWGWNYVVTASSANPELAYLFALFAASPEMSTESVRQAGGFFDPFRPEHYQDAVIQEIYSPAFLTVHENSMRSAIPDLYLANRSEYFQTLSRWLDSALLGRVSAKDALKKTAQQWRLISRRVGKEEQKKRWAQLRSKYPRGLRDRLKDNAGANENLPSGPRS